MTTESTSLSWDLRRHRILPLIQWHAHVTRICHETYDVIGVYPLYSDIPMSLESVMSMSIQCLWQNSANRIPASSSVWSVAFPLPVLPVPWVSWVFFATVEVPVSIRLANFLYTFFLFRFVVSMYYKILAEKHHLKPGWHLITIVTCRIKGWALTVSLRLQQTTDEEQYNYFR